MMSHTFSLRFADDCLRSFPKPAVMGVINVSPNSFYRAHGDVNSALKTAEQMLRGGATFLDVGGEATSPNVDMALDAPSLAAEMERVIPVVSALKREFNVLISVDTSRPEVMRASTEAGADIINDQRALSDPIALETVLQLKVPVCLMHFMNIDRIPGSCDPKTLFVTVKRELEFAVNRAVQFGITSDRIIIDPGYGGGNYRKNTKENFYLLSRLPDFVQMSFPVLMGWSRKSMIGEVLDKAPDERLWGTLAAETLGVYHGVSIIRTHDVSACFDVCRVTAFAKENSFHEE